MSHLRGCGKTPECRLVPWKSGALAPRKSRRINNGLQPQWSLSELFRSLLSPNDEILECNAHSDEPATAQKAALNKLKGEEK
jgi:hypothetical protein